MCFFMMIDVFNGVGVGVRVHVRVGVKAKERKSVSNIYVWIVQWQTV